MKRYRSKPSEIEATEPVPEYMTDQALVELVQFAPGKIQLVGGPQGILLLAGKDGAQEWVPVPAGHRLVRVPGDPSDIWPVEDAYFRAKYEEADGV